MQTTIKLDEELLEKAMKSSDLSTREDVVEEALRLLVQMRAQENLRKLRGKVQWDGNLDEMRQGRFQDESA